MGQSKQVVFLTGATGFIGRRLAVLLADRFTVRCLARDLDRARSTLPLTAEIILGDLTDPSSLREALAGACAVVHLAALKSDERDIISVNVGGAANLIEACKAQGVRRVINISSQAARMACRGDYGETKAQSDAIINTSGLEVTTLLASLVYGPQDPGVFGKLARVISSFPVVPVIGDGSVRYHPIYLDDLCQVIAGCLMAPQTIGKSYSIGGPEGITFEALLDLIAARLGKHPLKLHFPSWAALLIARIMALIFYSPPLSRSNVLGAIHGVPDADYLVLFKKLGLKPSTLAEGIQRSL